MTASEQDQYAQNNEDRSSPETRIAKVQSLNDKFRKTLSGGKILLTPGILELERDNIQKILTKVTQYDRFDDNIDPFGEHDMGAFDYQRNRIFWKIDYYDLLMLAGSPNPADPFQTKRVMTIMLASEY